MKIKTKEQIDELDSKLPNMPLNQIARIVSGNWDRVYFGAVPYLEAMNSLNSIKDNYFADSGKSIVTYFLGNAQTWRGDVARIVKAELNRRIKAK